MTMRPFALLAGSIALLTVAVAAQQSDTTRNPLGADPAAIAAGQRLYGLVEGDLLYAYDMAAMGQELQPHIWARLQRA